MTTSACLATVRPEALAAAGARAAIVVVCREPGAREILSRELSKRYGADYQIVVCDRPAELGTRMRDLLAARLPVAMVIGGIGAQDRDGIEVLAAIRAIDATAVRVATVRWGDWESARSIFDAITLGQDRPLGDASRTGPGRRVPPVDHRVPEGMEQRPRRRLRGRAGDRRALVRAVRGAA